MKQLKVFLLLKSFSKYELNRLRKFLNSPFFNENGKIVELFDAILPYVLSSKKTPKEVKKESIWQKIFGQLAYNDTHFRRLQSELLQLSLDFKQLDSFYAHPVKKDLELLPLLSLPHLKKHFEGVSRRLQKTLEQQKTTDSGFFLNQYFFETHRHDFNSALGSSGDYQHFVKADYYLDSFYIKEKLNRFVISIIYGNIRAKELGVKVIPGFLDYISQSEYFEIPIIEVFHKMALLFLEQENEQHFEDLILLLDKHYQKIPESEVRDIYFNAQNYCAIKINSGNVKYYRKMFSVHKALVEKKLIGEDKLNHAIYKNIITVGLRNKEFVWVEAFIKDYTHKLPKDIQSNALTYNLANVYFYQKQYDKVVDQLKEVEYSSHIYALGGKLMLLKTYYEIGEDRPLYSLIDSFTIYLRRNKFISKDVKQQYLNMLRFVKKILAIVPNEREALSKLKENAQKSKALAAKQWILEKITELER